MNQKIAVIGNSCSGKTTLSRKLGVQTGLPVFHVDTIQFDSNLNIRPYKESIDALCKIQSQERWIIDGYGPLDILQERLQKADLIIFIDPPIWRLYFWLGKRQLQNVFKRRSELVPGISELNWRHFMKAIKGIHKVHHLMRPEMLRILEGENISPKVKRVNSNSNLEILNVSQRETME